MEIAFDTEIDLNVSFYRKFELEIFGNFFVFQKRMCCSSTNRDFGSIPYWAPRRTVRAGARLHRENGCWR